MSNQDLSVMNKGSGSLRQKEYAQQQAARFAIGTTLRLQNVSYMDRNARHQIAAGTTARLNVPRENGNIQFSFARYHGNRVGRRKGVTTRAAHWRDGETAPEQGTRKVSRPDYHLKQA